MLNINVNKISDKRFKCSIVNIKVYNNSYFIDKIQLKEELFAENINSAKSLFLQKIKQYNPASLIIFDINIRQNFYSFEMIEASLVKSDILKLNEDEILLLKNLYHKETDDKEFMKWLAEKYNLKLICLTMAEKGALVISADEEIFSPGYRVNAIDTVGSGDAFTAGFVYKYLNNASLQESADFANLMGGYVAEHKGATPPVGKERLEIFRKHRCPVDVC